MVESEDFIFFHIPKTGGGSIVKNLHSCGKTPHESVHTMKTPHQRVFESSKYKFIFVRNPYDRLVSAFHWETAGMFYYAVENDIDIGATRLDMKFQDWVKLKFLNRYPKIEDVKLLEHRNESLCGEDALKRWVNIMKEKNTFTFPQIYYFSQHKHEDHILDKNNLNNVDFIGRYENIKHDWEIICEKINCIPNLQLENQTKERDEYRKYYDNETRSIVEHYYKHDLDYFEYKW